MGAERAGESGTGSSGNGRSRAGKRLSSSQTYFSTCNLALREFALGVEGLERFVARQPLRRMHQCVFGVLALQSEAVDPRL